MDIKQIFQIYSGVTIINFYEKIRPYIEIQGITTSGRRIEGWLDGFRFLYTEARKEYPEDAKRGGFPKSLEEQLDMVRKREEALKKV